jgi:outer membrane lipoprotein-sorting protein
MKCQEAIELMTDLFDVEKNHGADFVRDHLANCPACRARFEEQHKVFEAVRPASRVVASHQFREKTMKAIAEEAAREAAKPEKSGYFQGWRRLALAGCALVLLLLMLPILPINIGGKRSPAFTVLAQSVQAMSDVKSIYMTGRMRTVPGDSFELIGANYEFIPIELWREYSPSRWRVEKTGRVVVTDGQASTLYIGKTNQYMRGTPQSGFVEWLRPLLNPESILQHELDSAKNGSADVSATEANGTITLTVRGKAQGSFANTWTKNKSIVESDHTCIYKFDSATKRLQSLQVVIHVGTQDVTVLDLNDFRYDEAFPDTLFTLQIPAGATQLTSAAEMPALTVNISGPGDAAEHFFDGLAREDWNAVLDVYPGKTVPDAMKNLYGHVEVLSLGKPFKSGLYSGYFIPYKIRLRNGSEISHNLAVRNDNPQQRWTVDGGF